MLMYLAIRTIPDLAFALGQLSRFVARPSSKHIETVKRDLRFLVGTRDSEIANMRKKHQSKGKIVVKGFCDSNRANDPEDRKITT